MNNKKQKPKIIQILQDVDPDDSFSTIIGLGDDGVVYTASWKDRKWSELIPLRFESTCKLKNE
jgi:hypothetical protein